MTIQGRDRILIVDDDPGIRRALQRILQRAYGLGKAAGHDEALEKVRTGHFHAALVDVQLNDGDGYSLCRKIRRLSPDTDVILMTGSISTPDEKLYRSLEEDAFYFLFKPFDRRVLRALLERCLRLQKERTAKETLARELSEDLEQARHFQESLLPAGAVRQSGWHLLGRIEQCDALGGDLYYCQALPDDTLVFAVTDIVGHGVSAAMYAGMLRSSLDAARRRDPEPEKLVLELLHGIDFFEDSKYATLFYGQLHPDGRVRYFNAGHPPALWVRQNGVTETLDSTGLLLSSAFRQQQREVEEIELAAGERILVCTDGVLEALDGAHREFGLDGLRTQLGLCSGLSPEEAMKRLSGSVLEHCSGRPIEDDFTFLLIDRR